MKYLANVTTLTYAAEKCTGCGRCVEVALTMSLFCRNGRPNNGSRPLHGMRRLRPELRLWGPGGKLRRGLRRSTHQQHDHWRRALL